MKRPWSKHLGIFSTFPTLAQIRARSFLLCPLLEDFIQKPDGTQGREDRQRGSFLAVPSPSASQAENERRGRKYVSGFPFPAMRRSFLTRENTTEAYSPASPAFHGALCQMPDLLGGLPDFEMRGAGKSTGPTSGRKVLRRIYRKYIKALRQEYRRRLAGDIDLNWTAIRPPGRTAYRCTLCRRCARRLPHRGGTTA